MRVLFVSTWPPTRCGIASYSKNLVSNILNLSNNQEGKIGVSIFPDKVWKKYAGLRLLEMPSHTKGTQIVHVQHGFLLYGRILGNLLLPLSILITRLLNPKLNVVITLHSVPSLSNEELGKYADVYGFENVAKGPLQPILRIILKTLVKGLSMICERFIVHDPFSAKVLENQYGLEKDELAVIPHGISTRDADGADVGKGETEDKIQLAVLGFLRPHKDYVHTLFTLKELPENFNLVIAGSTASEYDQKTSQMLSEMVKIIRRENLESRVRLIPRFIEESEYRKLIRNADLILLPYRVVSGASGIISDAAGFGKPMLPPENPYFKAVFGPDWKWWLKFDPEEDARTVMNAINDVYDMSVELGKLRNGASWTKAAKAHATLYEELLI